MLTPIDKARTAVHTADGDKLKIGDTRHIAGAIEALSPSGFRGRPVELTPEQRKTAIGKIHTAINALADGPEKDRLKAALAKVSKSFHNVKSASGQRLWRGIVSVNTYDREDEATSEAGLVQVVKMMQLLNFAPELDFFHLEPEQHKAAFGTERLPGVADWYDVVDGHLVAVGHYHDDPVSKALAEYVDANPEGPDGSGWGMSWTFGSNRDEHRVFQRIEYAKKFTFLPYSQAAHSLTKFESEVTKMLTKEQQEAIDRIKSDPIVKAAVQTMFEAEGQSAVIDTLGVERKSVTPDANAQTLHGPNGVLNQPGAENGKAKDGKCPDGSKPDADGDCPPDKEPDADDKSKKSVAGTPIEAEVTLPAAKPTPPTGEPKKGLQPQSIAKSQLGQTRPLLTSDIGDMYEAITDIIEARVSKAIQETKQAIYADVSKALKERDDFIAEHEKQFQELEILKEAVLAQKAYDTMVEEVNKHAEVMADLYQREERLESISSQLLDHNVTPRISQIFKNLAASDSDVTVISEQHPLAKAHPAEVASESFAKYGLKPSRSNGAGGAA